MHIQWGSSTEKIAYHRGCPCFNEERASDGGEYISFVPIGAVEAPSTKYPQPDTAAGGA